MSHKLIIVYDSSASHRAEIDKIFSKRNQELTSNETDLLQKITELEQIMNSQDGLVRCRPEPLVQSTTQPTTPVQSTNNNKRVANDKPIRSDIQRDPVTGLPSSTTVARAMSNCDTSQMITQQEAMKIASNLILKEKLESKIKVMETAEAELNQSMETKLNSIIKKSVSSKEGFQINRAQFYQSAT